MRPQIKYPTYLGVLSHFDAVVYDSGDDFIPQDVTDTNPRRFTSATAQTGSQEMAPWFHHAMLQLRDYANEGGKLIVDGRNVHQTFTASTSTSLTATGPYTWTPDKLFGFFYPPNNEGDDDLPGTALQRSRTSPTTLAELPRRRRPPVGTGVALRRPRTGNPNIAGFPVAAEGRRPVRGHGDLHARRRLDGRAEPERRRHAEPAGPHPAAAAQLGGRRTNEPLRAERVEADFATAGDLHHGRRRDHLDA